ncbi:MAG: tetratricopeptide repeat protein [Oligoflexus sp.]
MDWDFIVKQARSCHTKEAWSQFLVTHGNLLMQTNQSKPISEVFKCLSRDQQSLNYHPDLWVALLAGCIASWDLDLGVKIAQFTDKIPYPLLAIRSAEIYLESGQPATARKVANRAMRLKSIMPSEEIQIQMIICKTYVEEGRQIMALRLLSKLTDLIHQTVLDEPLKGEILTNMARAHFFLGNYNEAATLFHQSFEIFHQVKYWESAAKGLFNAAACLHNSGVKQQELAFRYVEKCHQIAVEHDLRGPLSHCFAFYGTHEYQLGNFTQAAKFFRRALAAIPQADQSFRRLHILSMLTLSHLKKGQYRLAFHHGNKTLELAKQDESERFKARYITLESEINWQLGRIEFSQDLLQKAVKPLQSQGVYTLEQLSTLSRYYTQSALLNQALQSVQPKIAPRLKENTYAWMEFLIAKSDLLITSGNYQEAEKLALHCHDEASSKHSLYFANRSLVNLIQTRLARNLLDDTLQDYMQKLEHAAENTDLNRLQIHVYIAQASLAYRQGAFEDCIRILQNGLRCTAIPFSYQEVVKIWLATCEGHATKFHANWKSQFVTRATRIYFRPSLEKLNPDHYLVSGHYQVSLHSTPMLAKLMDYLIHQPNMTAEPEELQKQVWNQPLSLQGWQQKIRNTLMRLRTLFPYSIAPLILHDEVVRLNVEAISIHQSPLPLPKEELPLDQQVLILIKKNPLSSSQITDQLGISSATTKRILKKLINDDIVSVRKIGRNVQYWSDSRKNNVVSDSYKHNPAHPPTQSLNP